MTGHRPVLLDAMDDDALAAAALDRRWPKWATMCQLRSLGCPVLNGVRVVPGGGTAALRAAIDALAQATNTGRLMVRSDGGRESAAYHRGGDSFPLDQVERHATPLLAAGRAVILLEPTDRRTNQLSVLLRMDRPALHQPGSFTVEALGAGYDIGDLTRGGIHPQVTVSVADITWHRYTKPWWSDLRVERHMTAEDERVRRELRRRRLLQINEVSTVDGSGDTTAAATNPRLGKDPTRDVVRAVIGWFDIAFVIAATHPHRDWRCLAVSLSDLGDGRTVYWDIVDSANKYAMAADRRPA